MKLPTGCMHCPRCSSPDTSIFTRIRRCAWRKRGPSVYAYQDAYVLLATQLVGQEQVVGPVLDALDNKLRHPEQPTVLLLVGDNGVGKTYTARLLTQALSLRCGSHVASPNSHTPPRQCYLGDSVLVISGGSYSDTNVLAVAAARHQIIQDLLHHQKEYPDGIVLVDDISAMAIDLVRSLSQLFGRPLMDEHGHANPHTSFNRFLVLLTADFNVEGRTAGLGMSDDLMRVAMKHIDPLRRMLPEHVETIVYRSFTEEDACHLVMFEVLQFPCSLHRPKLESAIITAEAALHVVRSTTEEGLAFENARALKRVIDDMLIDLLHKYWAKYGEDAPIRAVFDLNAASTGIALHNELEGSSSSSSELSDL